MKWQDLRPSPQLRAAAALRAREHAARCRHLADWCEAMAAWNASRHQWLAARDWGYRQRGFREQAARWEQEASER